MIVISKSLLAAYYGTKKIISVYVGDSLVWPTDKAPTSQLFIGSVVRYLRRVLIGRLTSDTVSKDPVLLSVATPIFQLENDDAIHPTRFGANPNSFFEATETAITPCKNVESGEERELFKTDNTGRIVVKG